MQSGNLGCILLLRKGFGKLGARNGRPTGFFFLMFLFQLVPDLQQLYTLIDR
jgi:hypothetical protein